MWLPYDMKGRKKVIIYIMYVENTNFRVSSHKSYSTTSERYITLPRESGDVSKHVVFSLNEMPGQGTSDMYVFTWNLYKVTMQNEELKSSIQKLFIQCLVSKFSHLPMSGKIKRVSMQSSKSGCREV